MAWLSALASIFFPRVNSSQALSSIVLQPLLASRATLALNSGLGMRRLVIGEAPFRSDVPPQGLTMGTIQKNQTSPAQLPNWLQAG